MTVIAYDGRYVATDKQATRGSYSATCTKVFQVGSKVATYTGCADHGGMLIAWLRMGADPKAFPQDRDEKTNAYLAVFEWGQPIYCYENYPIPVIIEDPIFAAGNGRDYALAAMYLGFSAERAVEVASHFDVYCGMGVDVIDLWELSNAQPGGDHARPVPAPCGPGPAG